MGADVVVDMRDDLGECHRTVLLFAFQRCSSVCQSLESCVAVSQEWWRNKALDRHRDLTNQLQLAKADNAGLQKQLQATVRNLETLRCTSATLYDLFPPLLAPVLIAMVMQLNYKHIMIDCIAA